MEIKDKFDYIKVGINISNLVRSTLGPKGMNKMVIGKNLILTNDGATIIKNIKIDNPIAEIFKKLAISVEESVGDGTTTSVILTGQLLERALELINKNIHQTTIINGYNLARNACINYLNEIKISGNKNEIIKTVFGSKIPPEISDLLTSLVSQGEFKIFKKTNENPNKSEIINGYVFNAFTMNDRMKNEAKGNIAVLDFKTNLDYTKFHVTKVDELEKIEKKDRDYKKNIVNELVKKDVKCVFTSDSNPEFENYLTNSGISGIVIYKRDDLDNICKVLNAKPVNNFKFGKGQMIFTKPNMIKLLGENMKTILLCGSTEQVLDEYERALDDVTKVLKNSTDVVIGAGAVEIRLSQMLKNFAEKIGGKEQIAIEKFAEALESIPLIIAENAGLDSMEILSALKTLHSNGKIDFGVDVVNKVSDAKKRGVVEPVVMKMHSIASSSDVVNMILKLDQILIGNEKDT